MLAYINKLPTAAVLLDDPAIYLADFGVDVVAGATTGLGILDMPSEVIIDNQIITTDYALTCEASKFGDLLYGSQITVNGAAYSASLLVVDDGFSLSLAVPTSTLSLLMPTWKSNCDDFLITQFDVILQDLVDRQASAALQQYKLDCRY